MAKPSGRPRILFSVNSSWNVVNFRHGLVKVLLEAGYDVTVAAPRDAYSSRIEQWGCRYVDLPIAAHGRSPAADLRLLMRYRRLMRQERPVAYIGFTAKPNIWGSLAARLARVPAINNVAGLGSVFNERGPTRWILEQLYRLALRHSVQIFFQNAVDRDRFAGQELVPADRTAVLPGSGIDLSAFQPTPLPSTPPAAIFLLAARLLREKGIAEFAQAAGRIRQAWPDATFRIVGFLDPGNPAFVTDAELRAWQRDGWIEWHGASDDIRSHIAAADCVVLPSYYPEGTPRILLEAAASGRPVITTDTPGCRDLVPAGRNGFLVAPRDEASLEHALASFLQQDARSRCSMAAESRELACSTFGEEIIVRAYLAALQMTKSPSRMRQ